MGLGNRPSPYNPILQHGMLEISNLQHAHALRANNSVLQWCASVCHRCHRCTPLALSLRAGVKGARPRLELVLGFRVEVLGFRVEVLGVAAGSRFRMGHPPDLVGAVRRRYPFRLGGVITDPPLLSVRLDCVPFRQVHWRRAEKDLKIRRRVEGGRGQTRGVRVRQGGWGSRSRWVCWRKGGREEGRVADLFRQGVGSVG